MIDIFWYSKYYLPNIKWSNKWCFDWIARSSAGAIASVRGRGRGKIMGKYFKGTVFYAGGRPAVLSVVLWIDHNRKILFIVLTLYCWIALRKEFGSNPCRKTYLRCRFSAIKCVRNPYAWNHGTIDTRQCRATGRYLPTPKLLEN